ncbi:type II/IV secretion system ATPase subunit [Halocalculus aciditolerans]|uniref:Type II secretion system protein n=1 Tax=Halocalculus aciditolerans TaxID=1383812 RepID=A0A830FD24_9EURY|nr:type II/IV secretion system ATPase subunit [Halocalculus aciditolerans]GGL63463.1 type II secretion system protein [Halocalculus aciditolerans]
MSSSLPASAPPPTPPDDPEAWYAPAVVDQHAVHPGVVATIAETPDGFTYDVREPALTAPDRAALDRVDAYFEGVAPERPRTREGTVERAAAGLDEKHRRVLDRLHDGSANARRRLAYAVLCARRCLGELTSYALDDAVEVAATTGGDVEVHTRSFAPADTALDDPEHLDRFLSERLASYTVPFRDFDVPVVVYRRHLLDGDAFDVRYAVQEPAKLPGDDALLDAAKARVRDANVDGVVEDRTEFVRAVAERFLDRRLTAGDTRAWVDAARNRARRALAAYDLALPPAGDRYAPGRLDDLVYYVLRDLVGEGALTIPVRDPHLEDVEANRVGERVKVVPRRGLGASGRIPTNLAFDTETGFVSLVRGLAASDGVELTAASPSAKVNLAPREVPDAVTIRCAVALPVISEDGPHVSIRKQAPDALTPVDLVDAGSLPTELVTLLWLAYEHHGVVLFSGPTGVGKTTLLNAHMPFVAPRDRPISIDEGSREVALPHETGVSLTTRDHEDPHKRVTMADLMTESNYLNPDVEIIAEINTPASFETFGEVLNTGHGVLGTLHARDIESLVNRVVEQGLPSYLLREVDLVVFPRFVDGERYVGDVVELLGDDHADRADGFVEKDGDRVPYHTVVSRTADGGFAVADDPVLFETLAARTDRPAEAVEREFDRKHDYVRYLVDADVSDTDALFAFLGDIRADEAATVAGLGDA